mmetsp:Transcript_71786/g.99419  ORF Transcript_71786/g.99419 Transcript_71786/m.99419 type:complete len:83 (-) Transcript_71786:9-257(-)
MELMKGGDLGKKLKKLNSKRCGFNFCVSDVCSIVYQVMLALNFMHKKDIVHRDMKLENLLLFDKDSLLIKITDFGFASSKHD